MDEAKCFLFCVFVATLSRQ